MSCGIGPVWTGMPLQTAAAGFTEHADSATESAAAPVRIVRCARIENSLLADGGFAAVKSDREQADRGILGPKRSVARAPLRSSQFGRLDVAYAAPHVLRVSSSLSECIAERLVACFDARRLSYARDGAPNESHFNS